MEFKGLFVFIVVVGALFSVQGSPVPRDSSVAKVDEVKRFEDISDILKNKGHQEKTKEAVLAAKDVTTNKSDDVGTTTTKKTVIKPLQVSCKHEEATDDLICQEHCLPKGYSYGLCVGFKCSCI